MRLSIIYFLIAHAIAITLIAYGGLSILREMVQGIWRERGDEGAARFEVVRYCFYAGLGISLLAAHLFSR